MRIVLDCGHMGKASRPNDRGAVYKNTKESNIVLLYAVAAMGYLEKDGHIVYLVCHDDYKYRQEFCRKVHADIHIQCHLNAGKGSYSLILYKDNGAEKLADIMLATFCNRIKCVTHTLKEHATKRVRGFNSIMKDIPSLLIEPMFLDNDKHYEYLVYKDGTMEIGKIIAEAITEWEKIK